MKILSVVVPCYNEEENVGLFYAELLKQENAFRERDLALELLLSMTVPGMEQRMR